MKDPEAQKDGFQRFDFRFGVNAPGAEGVVLESSPGSLDPQHFRYLENARIKGNEVISRYGQEKAPSGVLGFRVVGLFDTKIYDGPLGAVVPLPSVASIVPFLVVTGSTTMNFYIPSISGAYIAGPSTAADWFYGGVKNIRGEVYVASYTNVGTKTFKLEQITAIDATTGAATLSTIFTITPPTVTISSTWTTFGGPATGSDIYVAMAADGTYKWDGAAVAVDDANTTSRIWNIGDVVYAELAATGFRKKSGGVWSNVAGTYVGTPKSNGSASFPATALVAATTSGLSTIDSYIETGSGWSHGTATASATIAGWWPTQLPNDPLTGEVHMNYQVVPPTGKHIVVGPTLGAEQSSCISITGAFAGGGTWAAPLLIEYFDGRYWGLAGSKLYSNAAFGTTAWTLFSATSATAMAVRL